MFYNNISTVLTIVPIFQFSSKMIWFMNWTKTNSAAAAAKPFSSKPSNISVNVLLYQSCSPGAAISYTDMLLYHCLIFFLFPAYCFPRKPVWNTLNHCQLCNFSQEFASLRNTYTMLNRKNRNDWARNKVLIFIFEILSPQRMSFYPQFNVCQNITTF